MNRHFFRRCRPIVCAACALVLVGSFGTRVAAQEHHSEAEKEHPSEAGVAEHEEHEFHRHHFAGFLGVTDGEVEVENDTHADSEGHSGTFEDEQAFTMGLDYEYRLGRRWGVGALVEYAAGDLRTWVVGIPLFLHPKGGWKLFVAPGLEDKEGHDREFVVLVALLYDFEVGRFTISPTLEVAFVDGEEIPAYGVGIGKGF